eukprot:1142788-Pelagomonas_calceolata.AAC.1
MEGIVDAKCFGFVDCFIEGSKTVRGHHPDTFAVSLHQIRYLVESLGTDWDYANKGVTIQISKEKKVNNYLSSENLLHQLRERRHIGSKSRESPSPEGKREASVGLVGFWKHAPVGFTSLA